MRGESRAARLVQGPGSNGVYAAAGFERQERLRNFETERK
jgi:hypothetical protein